MVEVVVFCEGQTEEKFIKMVVAPAIRDLQVYLKPQTLRTSQSGSGGALSFDRLKYHARNSLLSNENCILSTFVDLYKLDTSFPEFDVAAQIKDVYVRVSSLETALHGAVVSYVGCRHDRFIPYIQPHEFEGLLFSDVDKLVSIEPNWRKSVANLRKVVNEASSPEHINNGFETKPSRRLETLLDPCYRKTRHGPLAAESITLKVIEERCIHFHDWMERLRGLSPQV